MSSKQSELGREIDLLFLFEAKNNDTNGVAATHAPVLRCTLTFPCTHTHTQQETEGVWSRPLKTQTKSKENAVTKITCVQTTYEYIPHKNQAYK